MATIWPFRAPSPLIPRCHAVNETAGSAQRYAWQAR
jgi:hypothetical protein